MTDRTLRVAMVGQKGFPPVHGGIEKHVAELAARLGPLGIGVDIYSRPHYSPHQGATELDDVRVIKRPSIPTKHLDAISHTSVATLDVLRRPVDVVHYHALGPGLLAGFPRWLAKKKTVVTVHGLDWQRDKWGGFATRVLQLGEKASVVLPDRTIVVSKALREHYRDQYKKVTDYIPNGIVPPVYRAPDLMREHGIDGPYVLFVGRLVPEKGCHFLLEAWSRLPGVLRGKHQLVIAGDAGFTPGYVDKLKREAPERVKFLGYIHGPLLEELYTNAELLVLPSTLEGLSITLLEGLSYARCCLVSDIPPNLEAAADHAVFFRSGDRDDLTRQLAALLENPAKREKLGAQGQIHAIEHYSWDRVAQLTANLYREIVENSF
ncbi:glycosyl transferase family 1 [bacterium DOLZORAL124_64_63]|nr:MAG: glycosyl transferase family 1 [bacterium DOLZORAL124_64_63]